MSMVLGAWCGRRVEPRLFVALAPVEHALAPDVDEAGEQQGEEHENLDEADPAQIAHAPAPRDRGRPPRCRTAGTPSPRGRTSPTAARAHRRPPACRTRTAPTSPALVFAGPGTAKEDVAAGEPGAHEQDENDRQPAFHVVVSSRSGAVYARRTPAAQRGTMLSDGLEQVNLVDHCQTRATRAARRGTRAGGAPGHHGAPGRENMVRRARAGRHACPHHPMRLAWFTPLAPVRSGIASYSAMILPLLAPRHDIDVFVDDEVWNAYAPSATGPADGYRPRTGQAAAFVRRTTSCRATCASPTI